MIDFKDKARFKYVVVDNDDEFVGVFDNFDDAVYQARFEMMYEVSVWKVHIEKITEVE